ncbi:hypothetical protein FRB98_006520, partial [Tulasnella sp. 332]
AAHGGVLLYSNAGNWYQGFVPYNTATGQVTIQREWDTYNPILSATDPTIACNDAGQSLAAGSQLTATIQAGSKVTAYWNQVWPHAIGPMLTYMANCGGPCTGVNATTLKYFKIDEAGLLSGTVGSGSWADGQMIAQNSSWTSTIPASVPNGYYLLRFETIALHSQPAQFYPECAQIQVVGGGTLAPTAAELVSFPGAYSQTDPGIDIDVYSTTAQTQTTYIIPGPPLYAGASGSTGTGNPTTTSKSSTTSVQVTTSTPTTKPSTTTSSTTSSTTHPVTTTTSTGTVPEYGQCGGVGWTGSTTCASPYKCTVSKIPFFPFSRKRATPPIASRVRDSTVSEGQNASSSTSSGRQKAAKGSTSKKRPAPPRTFAGMRPSKLRKGNDASAQAGADEGGQSSAIDATSFASPTTSPTHLYPTPPPYLNHEESAHAIPAPKSLNFPAGPSFLLGFSASMVNASVSPAPHDTDRTVEGQRHSVDIATSMVNAPVTSNKTGENVSELRAALNPGGQPRSVLERASHTAAVASPQLVEGDSEGGDAVMDNDGDPEFADDPAGVAPNDDDAIMEPNDAEHQVNVEEVDAPPVKRSRGRPRKIKATGAVAVQKRVKVQKRLAGRPRKNPVESTLKKPVGRPRRDGRPAGSVPKVEMAQSAASPPGMPPLRVGQTTTKTPASGLPTVTIPGGPQLTAPSPGFTAYPFYNPYAYAAALTAQFPQPGSVPGQLPWLANVGASSVVATNAAAGPSGTNSRLGRTRAATTETSTNMRNTDTAQLSCRPSASEARSVSPGPPEVVLHPQATVDDGEGDHENNAVFVYRPTHTHPLDSPSVPAFEKPSAADLELGDSSQLARKVPPEIFAAYEAQIPFLHKRTESGMPELYELHQTFWVPQKSNFFLFMGSSTRTTVNPTSSNPSDGCAAAAPVARSSTTSIQVHNPAFFFWDPLPLVLGGIKCPERECGKFLRREGYIKGPRKVLIASGGMGGESCFWICGVRYKCTSCINAETEKPGVVYQSWDQRILDSLPLLLRSEFPATMTERRSHTANPSTLPERLCVQAPVASGPGLTALHPSQSRTASNTSSSSTPPSAVVSVISDHLAPDTIRQALASLKGWPSSSSAPQPLTSAATQSDTRPARNAVGHSDEEQRGQIRGVSYGTGRETLTTPIVPATTEAAIAAPVVKVTPAAEDAEKNGPVCEAIRLLELDLPPKRGRPLSSKTSKAAASSSALAGAMRSLAAANQSQTTAINQQMYKNTTSQQTPPVLGDNLTGMAPPTAVSLWHPQHQGMAAASIAPNVPSTSQYTVASVSPLPVASNTTQGTTGAHQIRSFLSNSSSAAAASRAINNNTGSQSSTAVQPPESQSQPQTDTELDDHSTRSAVPADHQ